MLPREASDPWFAKDNMPDFTNSQMLGEMQPVPSDSTKPASGDYILGQWSHADVAKRKAIIVGAGVFTVVGLFLMFRKRRR